MFFFFKEVEYSRTLVQRKGAGSVLAVFSFFFKHVCSDFPVFYFMFFFIPKSSK